MIHTFTFILRVVGSMKGQEYDFLIFNVFFTPSFAIKNLYIHIMFYKSSWYFCTFQCEKEEKTNSSEQNVKQCISVIIFSYGNTVQLWLQYVWSSCWTHPETMKSKHHSPHTDSGRGKERGSGSWRGIQRGGREGEINRRTDGWIDR